MPYKLIDPEKAPKPPAKKSGGTAAYFAELVENLPEDKIAEITPEEGQTIRGIKVSVGRVASARGISVQSYDDGDKVYVRRLPS